MPVSRSKAAPSSRPGGLRIGEPNDAYEHEADRVADEVMTGGVMKRHWSLASVDIGALLQRKCSCGGSGGATDDCEECGKEEAGPVVQRKSVGAEPGLAPPIAREVLNSPGRPLDKVTRDFFEPRFGHGFSRVRLHTDPQAAESARTVNSLAYTLGNHIVLGSGHYSPQTTSTKRLVAHELAHVVQQGNGEALPEYGISNPGDYLELQAPLAVEAVMADKESPRVPNATNPVQRRSGDPLSDPLGEGEKVASDPATERANEACGKPCGKFPWVEVAPDVFVVLCDDTVKMLPPTIVPAGCTPGRLGNVGFFSGSPAWQMPTNCDTCKATGPGSKAGPTSGISIGYIQTVEKSLSGGVYFQRDASGKWVWAGNDWRCVANARDGLDSSTAPWYGPGGNFGPEVFGTCPALVDTPHVTLPSGRKLTTKAGVTRAAWPLRRMRIDGIFHTWLVARPAKGPIVFIHHWSFQCWVVADLNEDADPCNRTAWQKMNMNKLITNGPGKGSATPVLTGATANRLQRPC